MGRILLLLALSALVVAGAALDNPRQTASEAESEGNAVPPPSEEDPVSLENRQVLKVFQPKEPTDKEGKLLAFYTTKTKALIVTSTAFALSTCFSTTNTPSCATGRKKRNIFNEQINPGLTMGSASSLDASLDQPDLGPDSEPGSENPSGRKFTVWSTSFSTYTVVSTSYYQGTTITVSALCNPGIAASCFG